MRWEGERSRKEEVARKVGAEVEGREKRAGGASFGRGEKATMQKRAV